MPNSQCCLGQISPNTLRKNWQTQDPPNTGSNNPLLLTGAIWARYQIREIAEACFWQVDSAEHQVYLLPGVLAWHVAKPFVAHTELAVVLLSHKVSPVG